MAPPAEPAPTRVPAVLAGDTVPAPAARPVATQIAAAEPPVPAPAVAADVPDAPSTPSAAVRPTSPSPPAQPGLGEITGGELIRSPTPAYPRRARLNGVEGQVTVRYTVDERGRVDELEVLSAEPGKIFQASVLKSVRRWRHEPFLADGEPVGARVTRTFEFAIRKEPLAAGEKPGAGCQRVTGSRICRSKDAYQELGIVVVHNPL
jgi:TonB family protein